MTWTDFPRDSCTHISDRASPGLDRGRQPVCSERFRTGPSIQGQNKWLKLNTLCGAPTVGAQLFAPVWCLVFRHPFLDPDSRLLGHPRADVILAPLRHKPRRFIRFAMQAETGMTCVGLLGPASRGVHAGFGECPGHLGNWDLLLRGRAQNGRGKGERLHFRIRCAGQKRKMRSTSWGFHFM